MKYKFNVANHLNNYLKKGVLVIVVFMLLTIPNMNVYSFIGRYQNSSPAITANNNYKVSVSYGVEKPVFVNVLVVALGALIGVAAVNQLLIAGSLAVFVSAAVTNSIFSDSTIHNHFDENYAPYDFSQFDN